MRRMYSQNQLEELALEKVNNSDITPNSVIEKMEGYSYSIPETPGWTKEPIYAGVVKNGNKLTLAVAINITKIDEDASNYPSLGLFALPEDIMDKIYAQTVGGSSNIADVRQIPVIGSTIVSPVNKTGFVQKAYNGLNITGFYNLTVNTEYYLRYEVTFLLSDNLAE